MYQAIKELCNTFKASLIVVSKNQDLSKILHLYHLGHRDFAENKVQNLIERKNHLPQDIRWHMIGHLQSNKVKKIASFIYLIHSVDSEELLQEIQKQAVKFDRVIQVLLQVKIAQEEQKFGLNPVEAQHIAIRELNTNRYSHIKIIGLMGMATHTDDQGQIEREFKSLKGLFDTIQSETQISYFNTLSMGMSDDYLIALNSGSNMLRIGTLAFEGI